jgi:hypothetical protein
MLSYTDKCPIARVVVKLQYSADFIWKALVAVKKMIAKVAHFEQ